VRVVGRMSGSGSASTSKLAAADDVAQELAALRATIASHRSYRVARTSRSGDPSSERRPGDRGAHSDGSLSPPPLPESEDGSSPVPPSAPSRLAPPTPLVDPPPGGDRRSPVPDAASLIRLLSPSSTEGQSKPERPARSAGHRVVPPSLADSFPEPPSISPPRPEGLPDSLPSPPPQSPPALPPGQRDRGAISHTRGSSSRDGKRPDVLRAQLVPKSNPRSPPPPVHASDESPRPGSPTTPRGSRRESNEILHGKLRVAEASLKAKERELDGLLNAERTRADSAISRYRTKADEATSRAEAAEAGRRRAEEHSLVLEHQVQELKARQAEWKLRESSAHAIPPDPTARPAALTEAFEAGELARIARAEEAAAEARKRADAAEASERAAVEDARSARAEVAKLKREKHKLEISIEQRASEVAEVALERSRKEMARTLTEEKKRMQRDLHDEIQSAVTAAEARVTSEWEEFHARELERTRQAARLEGIAQGRTERPDDSEREAAEEAGRKQAEAEFQGRLEEMVASRVEAARAEYEKVMADWEAATEEWRKETIASCERSLEQARKQLSSAKSQTAEAKLRADAQTRRAEETEALLKEAREARLVGADTVNDALTSLRAELAIATETAATESKGARLVREELQATRKELNNLQEEHARVKERLREGEIRWKKDLELVSTSRKELEDGHSSLRADMKHAETEVSSLKAEKRALEVALKRSEALLEELRSRADTADIATSAADQEAQSRKRVEEELEHERRRAMDAQQRAEEANQRLEEVQGKLQAAEAELSTALEAMRRAEADRQGAVDAKEQAQEALSVAERRAALAESKAFKAQLQAESAAGSESKRVADLEARIEQLQQELKKRNAEDDMAPPPETKTGEDLPPNTQEEKPPSPKYWSPKRTTKAVDTSDAAPATAAGMPAKSPWKVRVPASQAEPSPAPEEPSPSPEEPSTKEQEAPPAPAQDVEPPASTAGVSPRLMNRIFEMSASQLKALLTRARIPHAGCVEKGELRNLLLKAVERGAAIQGSSATSTSRAFEPPSVEHSKPRAEAADEAHSNESHQAHLKIRTKTADEPAKETEVEATPMLTKKKDAESDPDELRNWLPAFADDGQQYWYHRVTRAVRWERPSVEVARQMEARVEAEKHAVKVRQAARVKEIADEEERKKRELAVKETLQRRTSLRVDAWSASQDLRSMLSTLPSFLNWARSFPDNLPQVALTGSVSDVKKAYLRCLRVVHPDKMAGAPVEQQVEAQAVFAALQAANTKFQTESSEAETVGGRRGMMRPSSSFAGSEIPAGWSRGFHTAGYSARGRHAGTASFNRSTSYSGAFSDLFGSEK
jgi:hypothetical protein